MVYRGRVRRLEEVERLLMKTVNACSAPMLNSPNSITPHVARPVVLLSWFEHRNWVH